MLTNEQRAHDLAIHMLDIMKESKIQEQLNLRADNVSFDFYIEYKNLYALLLESFNRDFPQNEQ